MKSHLWEILNVIMWRSGAKVCPSNKIWDRECGGIWAAGAKSVTIQKLVQGNLELLILEFRTWSQSWCFGLGQKTSTAWAPLRVTPVLESEVWLVLSRFRVGTKSWYSLVFEQVTKKYQLRRRLACGRMEFGRCCDKWWKYWEHLEEKYWELWQRNTEYNSGIHASL